MESNDLFDVKNAAIAITGAASGIGLAYAELFAARGAQIAMIDNDIEGLKKSCQSIRANGGIATAFPADVANHESQCSAFNKLISSFGKIDVVFANAGISGGPGFLMANNERNPKGEVENIALDLWNRVLATNVTSVFNTFQAVVPQMKKQKFGRIIVTCSSSAAVTESLVSSIYATSKAAVAKMVKQYAFELAKYGILVNAISPGPVITNIAGGRFMQEEARRPFERAAPLGRIANVSDLHGAALFLSSAASSHITGIEITVDGGRSLGRAED